MKTTIDEAGRGRPRYSEPTLVLEHGFLVHHGPEPAEIDVVSFIAAEREGRIRDIVRIE